MSKFIHRLRRRLENVRTAPVEELGSWARFARYQFQLWRFCARRLREHNAMAMSAALSFRTIFALVPILVLALLVLKSIGMLPDSQQGMQYVLEKTGLDQIAVAMAEETPDAAETRPSTKPAAEDPAEPFMSAPWWQEEPTPAEGKGGLTAEDERKLASLAQQLQEMVSNVEKQLTFGRIGPIGAALLIWTALTLLTTIETSLNRIFQAPRGRPLAKRMMLYWSALTFVPIALVSASYAADKTTKAAANVPGVSWLIATVGWLGPIVVGVLVLTMIYMWMPNTRVRFKAAFAGAVAAVPMWLLAKWGFSLYVSELVGKGRNVYGALGLIPLFLIWMNASWLIFLFGAELAHTVANLKRMRSAEQADQVFLGPWELLAAAVAIARPYLAGKGPVPREDIYRQFNLPEEGVVRLLDRLQEKNVICPVDMANADAFVPARPADEIRVLDLLNMVSSPKAEVSENPYVDGGELGQIISGVRGRAESSLQDESLAQLASAPVEKG